MSTFFPAGGRAHKTGPWWKVLHNAIDAGADLDALRLVHIVGISNVDETMCERIEHYLHEKAACVRYDDTSLLIIEPGVTDEEVIKATEYVLGVSRERLHLWRVLRALDDGLEFESIDAPSAVAPQTAAPAPAEHAGIVLTDAEFSYFPLWDVRASEIFCYVCENVWNIGTGERVSEVALDAFFAKPRHVFALDREALHKAVLQAQDFLDRYLFTNILIPVHYSTVASQDFFAPYIEVCAQSVWPVVDNIYFEITKVPADADLGQLAAAADALRPYGQGVLLRLERDFGNFTALPALDVLSVGLDYHYDTRADADVHDELEAFARAARPLGLRCHAHSLGDMNLCITAVRCGFDFISSTVIAPPLDTTNPDEQAAQPPDVLRAMLKGMT